MNAPVTLVKMKVNAQSSWASIGANVQVPISEKTAKMVIL